MKRPGIGLSPSGALASLLLLASGCGDENLAIVDPSADERPPATTAPEVEAPAAPEIPTAPAVAAPSAPGIADERGALDLSIRQDPLAEGVVRVLQTRCASCHAGASAEGGLADVADLASQIARGNIVPGAAAQSPLALRMLDGSMPPPVNPRGSGRGRPTPGELALVTRFIDQLPASPAVACSALPFLSTDAVYSALLADVLQAPASDRPFLRYVGLTYASNAGWCGPALERQRSALFKLVNSVSTAPEVRVPTAVDSDGLLYRIDLRDYGWNRAIDRDDDGSADFDDGWLAIAAGAGPYAMQMQGPEASELQRETGSLSPFLPAHALLHSAAGESYYALLGLPLAPGEIELRLGVSLYEQVPGLVLHAGFEGPQRDSIVRRTEQSTHPGRFFWMITANSSNDSESIFGDPFDFGFSPEVLFHLPNGLLAFHREDSEGALAPLTHSAARNVASCHSCHQAGLLPVTDMVRPIFERNRTLFDSSTAELIEQSYPPSAELDVLIQADSALHISASERAGVVSTVPEPLSYVYYQFENDLLSLPRVAAELAVTPEQLQAHLPQLGGDLLGLRDPAGTLRRGVLNEAYARVWCTLHAADRNRPVSCP